MVDKVKLCFLKASDVAGRAGEHGVNGIFASLVVKTAGVPISDVKVWLKHSGEAAVVATVAEEAVKAVAGKSYR